MTAEQMATHLKCHHMFGDPHTEAEAYGYSEHGLGEFHDFLHRSPQSDVDEDHSGEEISQ